MEERLRDAPESLRRAVMEAVEDCDPSAGASLSEALRHAADEMLERARKSSDSEGDPLVLLAADALVTYSCEAAALYDPESLAGLR